MICHFNLDTFETLKKLQHGSIESFAENTFRRNHLAGAGDAGIPE